MKLIVNFVLKIAQWAKMACFLGLIFRNFYLANTKKISKIKFFFEYVVGKILFKITDTVGNAYSKIKNPMKVFLISVFLSKYL